MSFVGRQFPDKVIDVIDEACVTRRMQVTNKRKADIDIDSQKEVVTAHKSSKKPVVGPDHVAQVSSLGNIWLNTDDCFSVVFIYMYVFHVLILTEGH